MLIDLSSWYKSSLSPKIEEIQAVIQQHHTIRFSYFSPKGESVRTVEPLAAGGRVWRRQLHHGTGR